MKKKQYNTAFPLLLLEPICKDLNVTLIETEVRKYTGKFLSKNYYGEEKVKRLNELNIYECDKFYSDLLSDIPLNNISKKAYLIKKVIPWTK